MIHLGRIETMIHSIPSELLFVIVNHLDAKAIHLLSATSSRFHQILSDPTIWRKVALDLMSTNTQSEFQTHLVKELVQDLEVVKELKSNCLTVFKKYGSLIGLWHKDYSFYLGGLVRIRPRKREESIDLAPYVLVGEILSCPEYDEEVESFALNRNISISKYQTAPVKTRLSFGINAHGITCLGKGLKYIHDSTLLYIPSIEEMVLEIDMSMGGLAERLGERSFPTGLPDPNTGLWGFPSSAYTSDETLQDLRESRSQRISTNKSCIIAISCSQRCHCNRVRIPSPTQLSIDYTTKLSKLEFRASSSRQSLLPRPGLWMAPYGSHGNEFISLSYCNNQLCITKITGDLNVPRGEASILMKLDDIKEAQYLGSEDSPTLLASQQLLRGVIYNGKGTIAMEGFRNPRTIPVDGKPISNPSVDQEL
jgi:hypothetical protein